MSALFDAHPHPQPPSLDSDAIELANRSHHAAFNGQESDPETLRAAGGTPPPDDIDPATVALVKDVPPDGGYGWVVTLAVFLINVNTWGINSAWGIFMEQYIRENTFPEASQFEYALIGGLSVSLALILGPIISAIQRNMGTRCTMIMGSLLTFGGLFSASAASRVWHLFMSVGLCMGFGFGLLYIPAMGLLPPWFSRHRSLALGLATAGAGGGIAWNLITGKLLEVSGLKWTWRILGLVSVAFNIICAFLCRERPITSQSTGSSKRRSFNIRDFGRTQVLLILLWGFITEFGYISLWYSLPSYATSIGLTPGQGSVVNAMLSLGVGVGRPILGALSDRFGRINLALLCCSSCAILCLTLWILARSYAGLIIFALAAGAGGGCFWATVNPILAETVSLAESSAIFGTICFALVIPTTFGEAIALQLVKGGDGVNKFMPGQIFVGCTFLGGTALLMLLRSWQICEIERKSQGLGGGQLGEGHRRSGEESRTEEDLEEGVMASGRSAGVAVLDELRSSAAGMWSPRKLFVARRV
ncbi:major facilitator superfamily domain-containing protein [Pseudoneurospora amorphoporcata]|uniref:Major facilitator superfamily domain-containing protein n=1 Tax=Pseudoneurospora amorphoporcata TaxID=241081 RepID=A0AAN6P182_9PEZI|nr:major facilitator superfamily domain-containing protein [Pseudoneurospora amorphoporcata]